LSIISFRKAGVASRDAPGAYVSRPGGGRHCFRVQSSYCLQPCDSSPLQGGLDLKYLQLQDYFGTKGPICQEYLTLIDIRTILLSRKAYERRQPWRKG
jgi:hypothetical protein